MTLRKRQFVELASWQSNSKTGHSCGGHDLRFGRGLKTFHDKVALGYPLLHDEAAARDCLGYSQ